jgi:hypothetical protein
MMRDKIGNRATWIVPSHQADAYFKAGAEDIIEDPGKNVSRARNLALEHSFNQYSSCLMLDDDLIDCKRYQEPNKLVPISFEEAVSELVDELRNSGLKLAATTHVTNPLFLRHGYSIHSAINGGCLLVEPNPLRFDESIRLSEDVDYALQHIVRYGGALRSDELVLRFKRRAPGGVQNYRTDYERERSVQQLMNKWPGIVIPSKKDPFHPVVRISSRNRRVLLK